MVPSHLPTYNPPPPTPRDQIAPRVDSHPLNRPGCFTEPPPGLPLVSMAMRRSFKRGPPGVSTGDTGLAA
ncbi:hypothetical protein BO71DRAFT_51029 [Aspergillus ellipticus CBS 707.79]|uniref:Uncharacterized protein n=1 Tax=Aspergillus ellipticus CBS 707.79 TaxID=1448320 RepID=A0A319DTI2_9EURO|nr:hypothetical protein BO71DRAFT_51029 [Aspergillus ellipticus CBS 707.79]